MKKFLPILFAVFAILLCPQLIGTLCEAAGIVTTTSNIGNGTMNQMLLKGIEKNDIDMITTAVENGANVNIYGNSGLCDTALTLAFRENNNEIIDYLIKKGADVNAKIYPFGWNPPRIDTPLMKAINLNPSNIELVQKLVDNGANINFTDPATGSRALDQAISKNSLQIVKYLISKDASVNYKTKFWGQRTPLMFAIGQNDLQMVQILLDAGADPKIADKNGKIALDYAIDTGNKELINLFMPQH